MNSKYMVEILLPSMNREIYEMMDKQQEVIQDLVEIGVLVTYSLAADKSKVWVVLQVDSESELLSHIESLPLTKYADYNYVEIMYNDSINFIPKISLN